MKVASAAADLEREATSSDWPRRSTKPDAEGRAMHPLSATFRQSGNVCIETPVPRELTWPRTCGIARKSVRRR